jgi:hypothetical protein
MPRQYTRIPPADRFWKFVNKTNDCWLWTGNLYPVGYGCFSVSPGKSIGAHRCSWQLANGPIPDGLYILHRCDVRACVRPDHLFLGTQADNVHDTESKGRARYPGAHVPARGDRHGSRLHPESTPRGEQHPAAKLDWAKVRDIRARYAVGGVTCQSLADEYGVSMHTVWDVIKMRYWREGLVPL